MDNERIQLGATRVPRRVFFAMEDGEEIEIVLYWNKIVVHASNVESHLVVAPVDRREVEIRTVE